jgi:hypothetical protein
MHLSHASSFTVTGGAGSHKPQKGWSLVAVSGGALSGVVIGLVVDLEPLRVNGVILGTVNTELLISSTFSAERKEQGRRRSKTIHYWERLGSQKIWQGRIFIL